VQMDGLAKTDDLVFLLAASNLPWLVTSNALHKSCTVKYYTARLITVLL